MNLNLLKKCRLLLLLWLLPGVAGTVFAGGLGKSLGFGAVEEFLPPEQAFVFTAEVVDAQTIVARWTIADGYYLYRDKFSFRFPQATGVTAGQPDFPAGKFKDDEYFGRMEVYYHEAVVTLPVQRQSSARQAVELEVRYQGCADRGFCYPPMKQRIDLVLPAAEGAVPAAGGVTGAAGGTPPLAEEDRIARSLASGSLWLNLLGFFGFGLLLAFTPCVFPMVPILSGIIVGQGEDVSTRKAFLLSLSYVLAMALTYTAAGVAAALFGSNFQIMFQNPWVLAAFSALFVLLALSMFGLYQFQLPAALQTRLSRMGQGRGGGLTGAAIMGFLSALIVGPCVAAPLAGILLYIGMSGDAWLGGLSLFVLSLGMGLPLVVFGTSAGSLLPRAGPWMETVKHVFGVLLLGVAIWLLERIVPPGVTLLLWAALLIVIAVYMGAFERLDETASGWRRLWKGAGLVMAVYGVILVVGAASGGRDVFHPLAGGAFVARSPGEGPQSGAAAVFQRVKGVAGLEREISAAAARGQPVMVDFYADWCIECKRMERATFADPAVRRVLAGMRLLQVDVTDNDAEDQALLKKFGLFGPPAVLFFDTRGEELRNYRLIGFLDAAAFSRHARNVLAGVS